MNTHDETRPTDAPQAAKAYSLRESHGPSAATNAPDEHSSVVMPLAVAVVLLAPAVQRIASAHGIRVLSIKGAILAEQADGVGRHVAEGERCLRAQAQPVLQAGPHQIGHAEVVEALAGAVLEAEPGGEAFAFADEGRDRRACMQSAGVPGQAPAFSPRRPPTKGEGGAGGELLEGVIVNLSRTHHHHLDALLHGVVHVHLRGMPSRQGRRCVRSPSRRPGRLGEAAYRT